MYHALWIAKKNQVLVLIKKISDHFGGDEENWLKSYSEDVIELNKLDIQKALNCFWNLEENIKWLPRRVTKNVPRRT